VSLQSGHQELHLLEHQSEISAGHSGDTHEHGEHVG